MLIHIGPPEWMRDILAPLLPDVAIHCRPPAAALTEVTMVSVTGVSVTGVSVTGAKRDAERRVRLWDRWYGAHRSPSGLSGDLIEMGCLRTHIGCSWQACKSTNR